MVQFHVQLTVSQLEHYIDNIPQAALLLDDQGKILMVNHVLLKATGHELSSLVNASYSTVISSVEPFSKWIEQIYGSEKKGDPLIEVNWQDKGGRIHRNPVLICRGEDQERSYFFITFFNITLKKTRSILDRFTEQLTRDINLGILVIDKEGRIIEASSMVSRLLMLDKCQIVNQPINAVFSSIPDILEMVDRTLHNGLNIRNHAATFNQNGQQYQLLFDFNVIKDENESIVGAYVLIQDVTEIKKLEQKMTHHDRLAMIGQIAAGTAHEIRNPLTSVRGFLQMLGKSLEDHNLQKEKQYTDIMLTEIQRINMLVNEFLLLSKPKNTEYQTIDLNVVFSELLPFIENEALLNGVQIDYRSSGQLPFVIGNSDMLKQVFLNICKNGIEAMENEGSLTIYHAFNENRKEVNIYIQDTGPGIPEDDLEKIFDPFYTTKQDGTGLGLPICQKIVHDIGGEIKVLSSNGNGTTFEIRLPCL